MEVFDQLKELWDVLIALPGQVYLDAFYLFVVLGLLKKAGVVRGDAYAAAANAFLAVFITGGFSGINELSDVLQTSGVAVIGAVYYHLWKLYVGPFIGGLVGKLKDAIPAKK